MNMWITNSMSCITVVVSYMFLFPPRFFGDMVQFDEPAYFSDGVGEKPPTRYVLSSHVEWLLLRKRLCKVTGPWGVVWTLEHCVGAPLELIWIGDTCKIIGDIVTSDLAVQYDYIYFVFVYCTYILFKEHIIISWTISVNGSSLVQYQRIVEICLINMAWFSAKKGHSQLIRLTAGLMLGHSHAGTWRSTNCHPPFHWHDVLW